MAAAGAAEPQYRAECLAAASSWRSSSSNNNIFEQQLCTGAVLTRSKEAMLLVRCLSATEASLTDPCIRREERLYIAGARKEVALLLGQDAVAALESTAERMTLTAVIKAAADECGGDTSGTPELILVSCLVALVLIDRRVAHQQRAAAWRELVEQHGATSVVDSVVAVVLASLDLEDLELADRDDVWSSCMGDIPASAVDVVETIVAVGLPPWSALLKKAETFFWFISDHVRQREQREAAHGFRIVALKPADLKVRVVAALLLAHGVGWGLPDKWAVAAVIQHPALFTVEWVRSNAAEVVASQQLFAALKNV